MLTDGKKLDGRYLIHREIGSGGFGAVYLATDTRFSGNNQVAIKQILHSGEQSAKAFQHEADLLYNLTHQNLPRVTNCFQENGANYIVMEYVSGEDLSVSLKKGKCYTVAESLKIADAVLDALEYLHSFLIFHRDIKPHNIKINEHGKIYLLDFGTAKGTLDETTLTQAGQSITGFTPFYAPLEQVLRVDTNSFLLLQSLDSPNMENFLNRKTDARSDIYGLGATLYHLLTNCSPEKATSTIRAFSIWSDKPDPLPLCHIVNSEVSEDLALIVHRCLDVEPEKRFQTAAELRRALKNSQTKESSPKISELLTVALPVTSNQSIPPLNQLIQDNTAFQSRPFVEFAEAENKEVPPPAANLFDAQNNERTKPKSRVPLYLGFVFLLITASGLIGWLTWRNSAAIPPKIAATKIETTPLPAVKKSRTLTYSLLVQKMRDGKKFQEPFASSGQEIFESGYQFQMNFTPPDAGYLYAFAEGLDARNAAVFNAQFPTPLKNNGSAEVVANQQYETGWNQFDGTSGTENFWIVWSREKTPIAETARENAFNNKGIVSDDELKSKLKDYLETASKNKIDASKDIDKKLTRINFENDTLVYLVQLEHR